MTHASRHFHPFGGSFVTARAAYLLERAANLNSVRAKVRGKDAELDQCLLDIHFAALAYEDAATSHARTSPPKPPLKPVRDSEQAAPLDLLGTRRVAERLNCSTRNVQKLVEAGAIEATKIGGRLAFTPDAVENYRKRRSA